MLNYNYARVVNGEKEYAPTYFFDGVTAISSPTAETYASHEYYPVANNRPLEDAPAGYHWERLNSQLVDGMVYDNWTQVEDLPVVRSCTPYALKRAMEIAGIWDTVNSILTQQNLLWDFAMVQELREDNAQFAPMMAWAIQQFGEGRFNKILDAASRGTEYVNTLSSEDFNDD